MDDLKISHASDVTINQAIVWLFTWRLQGEGQETDSPGGLNKAPAHDPFSDPMLMVK